MTTQFYEAEQIIQSALERIPAIQLYIIQNGNPIYDRSFGYIDFDTKQIPVQDTTRFDMASVTKLFTTSAFMSMAEEGLLNLDMPVSALLPAFSGLRPIAPYEAPLEEGTFLDVSDGKTAYVDAGKITFRQLLSHSAGLPAWRPLYLLANRTAANWGTLSTYFSYQPGDRVVYSDFDLILVGLALEAAARKPLEQVIDERVCQPLGLRLTGYLPYPDPDAAGMPPQPAANTFNPAEVAPTEICRWRKRRLVGEVDDENAGRMGGIAGHAGIFSTAHDITALGQSYLQPGRLLKPETITEMTRQHSPEGQPVRRGIGFDLWVDNPDTSAYPFSPSSFGHTGFTGTSLWVDPQRGMVTALLTNEVYHGRANRVIFELRQGVHQAVVKAVDAANPA